MFFVSEMDVDHASFREVVEKLTELYGKKIAPFYQPIRENEKFVGYVNVMKMAGQKIYRYRQERRLRDPGILPPKPGYLSGSYDGCSGRDQ